MNEANRPLVVYHGNCADGFNARIARFANNLAGRIE